MILCVNCLTTIVTFLQSSTVSDKYKVGHISTLIKKPGFNSELIQNCGPVSTLPFLSKIIEKLVAQQLTSYLQHNKLNEMLQSSYKKYHSVEISMLLQLSAAFDTIDHSILLHRLESRFV